MIKNIFFTILTAFVFTCANAQQDGYHVHGTVENAADGDTVYIAQMQGFYSLVPKDSTIVRSGRYALDGAIDGADIRFLVYMKDGKARGFTDFILENDDVVIDFLGDSAQAVVKAGREGQLYEKYTKLAEPYDKKSGEAYATANDTTLSADHRARAKAICDSVSELRNQMTADFIMQHIPSAISDMLLAYNASSLSEEQRGRIEQAMETSERQYMFFKEMKAERKAAEATQIGKTFTDIALAGPDGKVMKVSSYVAANRYTLVDFWASWCGPCRAEMPYVKDAYSRFREKGLEIVGISLDNNRDAWLKAVDSIGMPWPQMSDLKGWQCEAAAAYNVKAIPANVLIDQKGTIVAKDLRGDDLGNKLAELLGDVPL